MQYEDIKSFAFTATKAMLCVTRALSLIFSPPYSPLRNKTHMDCRPRILHGSNVSRSTSLSPPREAHRVVSGEATISLPEWQAWGTSSPVPAMVTEIVEDLKVLERETDAQMSFGSNHGKLQVNDSTPFQFFLFRKNNVWCLYPNKNAGTKSVQDSFARDPSTGIDFPPKMTNGDETMNFILIDGTWSNSAAMFRRLKEQAKLVWGDDLPCISLSAGASAMHKLRPQPSWDRTCTAAAAIGLLCELQVLPAFSSLGLDKKAEALENALEVLLQALTDRRLRMGRSITRRERHNRDIC
ncbi:unnamed protein product [Ilex paraguariensis]|uniref:tRNA-uridine aminocarboxypropyltransferase n=1 Tax=Ilex paraguariensis TaxID=185542 RepID=A0ABC8TNU8_9AQUA